MMTLSSIGQCQTSFIGTSNLSGGSYIPTYQASKALGLVALYDANIGVMTNSSGNVVAWNDATGNGYTLSQYISTNQPTTVINFSTNTFPAVYFSGIQGGVKAVNLRNDSLAPLFSGVKKPFTIMILCNAQTNSLNSIAMSFGNGTATNSNASEILIAPNVNTVTSSTILVGCDTNANSSNNSTTVGVTTNTFHCVGATFDGTTIQSYDNLKAGASKDHSSMGQMTLNQFALGSARLTNSGTARVMEVYITQIRVYTNGLSGLNYTNEETQINNTYNTKYH